MPPLLPLPQDCTVFETENKILHVVSPAAASRLRRFQIKRAFCKRADLSELLQRHLLRLFDSQLSLYFCGYSTASFFSCVVSDCCCCCISCCFSSLAIVLFLPPSSFCSAKHCRRCASTLCVCHLTRWYRSRPTWSWFTSPTSSPPKAW